MAAEVSVMHTDASSGTSSGSATLVDTPQPQSSLSTNIVPDYSLAYYSQGTHICGIGEEKKLHVADFNDHRVRFVR